MKLKLIAWRVITLIALAACTASLLDYILPSPAFCGFKAGCDEVTHSAYGTLLWVPLSVWGLIAFAVFYLVTLFPNGWRLKLLGPMAILAGVCGLGLILLQMLVVKKFCPTCLIVDAAAVLLAAVELGITTPIDKPAEPLRPRKWLWTSFAALAIAGPVMWPMLKPAPPVPDQVKAYWQPGKITIVEITDFECPHCRETHPALQELLDQHADEVHFVRVVSPLDTHPNAQHAARAYQCACRQDQGNAMAHALFESEELGKEACEQLASDLGLEMGEFRACVGAATTDKEIARQIEWLEDTGLDGLPLIWVQDQLLLGSQTFASLNAALQRARRSDTDRHRLSTDTGR